MTAALQITTLEPCTHGPVHIEARLVELFTVAIHAEYSPYRRLELDRQCSSIAPSNRLIESEVAADGRRSQSERF